jgi:hypothetical protein
MNLHNPLQIKQFAPTLRTHSSSQHISHRLKIVIPQKSRTPTKISPADHKKTPTKERPQEILSSRMPQPVEDIRKQGDYKINLRLLGTQKYFKKEKGTV